MNFLTKQNFIEMYHDAADALKAVSRNRTASHTRIAIWNSFFPETPLSLSTSLRHILTRIFHQYLSGGTTDRFCFELSVLFLDLPTHFYELTSIFPAPLSIAMRNAYKVVNNHLQKPNQESMAKLIKTIFQTLPKEKLPLLKAILQAILWDKSNLDQYIDQIREILEPYCFDAFLEALPPTIRLRYALRYNRPPPKVIIDYHNLEMPLEFLQAIGEIDGSKESRKLSTTKDLETILESFDESNLESESEYNLSSSSEDNHPSAPAPPNPT